MFCKVLRTNSDNWKIKYSREGVCLLNGKGKIKQSITGLYWCSQIQYKRHMKVVRLSALGTGRLYPTGNISGSHFCYRLSHPQGHSVARRIMPMKNSNDTIGNRTSNLPTCSPVPQPTSPPRTSVLILSLRLCVYVTNCLSVSEQSTKIFSYISHFFHTSVRAAWIFRPIRRWHSP